MRNVRAWLPCPEHLLICAFHLKRYGSILLDHFSKVDLASKHMKYITWAAVLLLLVVLSAFVLFKPVRVFAHLLLPEMVGLRCQPDKVCVEDLARLDSARALLYASQDYLESQWDLSIEEPRIIFCSTDRCRDAFGLSKSAGHTFVTLDIVIAPRGWHPHYVAHELIHYWQAEQFGPLVLLNGDPWLIEGMAYALSNDPRPTLHEPYESYRQRFMAWYHPHADVPLKQSMGEALR